MMRKILSSAAVAAAALLLVANHSLGSAAAGPVAGTGAVPVAHQGHHAAAVAPIPPAGARPTAPAGAPNAAPSAPDTADLGRGGASSPERLLQLLGERIVAKDINGIIALHEPQAVLVDYDGSLIQGHAQIRAFYTAWFTSNPVLKVNPLQVVKAGGERGPGGQLRAQSASVMGTYTLEQNAASGGRESFSGNFCDIVRQQPNGRWLYVQDNPYPPHQ